MDKIGGLPVVRQALPRQQAHRHFTQPTPHQRRQPLERLGAAVAPGLEQAGQVGVPIHSGEL